MGLKQVKCGRCDRNYSAFYGKCPYCGAKKNKDGKTAAAGDNTKWQVIVGLVVLILIIVAVVVLLAMSLKDRDPEPSPGKNPVSASPKDSGVTTVTSSPTTAPSAPPTATPTPTPEATPEPVVNSIVLSREDFTLSGKGSTYTIIATISPAGSNAEIIWISEDPSVASVDENGLVTALKDGKTIVSATAGGITKECIVRVTNAGSGDSGSGSGSSSGSLSLSHSDVTIHSGSGETFMLKVNGAGDGATITYESDKSGVASVESNGRVKAVSNGTANITVKVKTADGKETTLTCVVRVVN